MVMVRSLEPQEMADVSVQMCSPSTAGMYQGQWRMCTATGLYYGGEQPLPSPRPLWRHQGPITEWEGRDLPAPGLNTEHGVKENIKGAALLSWSVFSKHWNKLHIT